MAEKHGSSRSIFFPKYSRARDITISGLMSAILNSRTISHEALDLHNHENMRWEVEIPVFSRQFQVESWFFRRDAMHSATYAVMQCPSICLSDRLSRLCIVSKWANIFSIFFVIHTILLFSYQTLCQYSDGDNGGIECRSRCSTSISHTSEMMQV